MWFRPPMYEIVNDGYRVSHTEPYNFAALTDGPPGRPKRDKRKTKAARRARKARKLNR